MIEETPETHRTLNLHRREVPVSDLTKSRNDFRTDTSSHFSPTKVRTVPITPLPPPGKGSGPRVTETKERSRGTRPEVPPALTPTEAAPEGPTPVEPRLPPVHTLLFFSRLRLVSTGLLAPPPVLPATSVGPTTAVHHPPAGTSEGTGQRRGEAGHVTGTDEREPHEGHWILGSRVDPGGLGG